MGQVGAASAYAMRAARAAAAAVVLSLLFTVSMGLVHAGTGGHAVGTEHIHAAAESVRESLGAPEYRDRHHHGEPVAGEAGAAALDGGVPDDDVHHDEDAHHHHLVDVDAGVVLQVIVAASHRTGPLRPMTAASSPTPLFDGGGRPD